MAQSPETLDALFVNLVMIFKTAAFQQMGKTLNPMTGKLDKNLDQARFSIDMIEMLKEKTSGNLSEDLSKLVDSTLLELRMNYVEEAGAGEKAEKPGEEPEGKQDAGAGEHGPEATGEPSGKPSGESSGKPDEAGSEVSESGTGKEGPQDG